MLKLIFRSNSPNRKMSTFKKKINSGSQIGNSIGNKNVSTPKNKNSDKVLKLLGIFKLKLSAFKVQRSLNPNSITIIIL